MKKLVLFLAMSVSATFFSQESSVLESRIQNYSKKVDSIVTREKSLMNSELSAVDESFRKSQISEVDQRNQKQLIAVKYENIINEKIAQEKEALNELTKISVNNSIMKKNDTLKNDRVGAVNSSQNSVVNISYKKKKSPKDLLRTDGLALTYGFLNLTKDAGSFDVFNNDSEMRIGNSHSFELQARRERQLGSFTSPLFIRYGLAYRADTYMPKRPQVFVQDNELLFLEDFAQGNLKRSKLRNVYITLPVDFQWVLNPKYIESEGINYLDASKKQWRIGAGIYAGVRTRSIVKVKYDDANDKFQKDQFTLDYGVNSFLFGGKVSVSYGGLNIFIKKDFSPIFNNSAILPNKNAIQLGIDLTNLNF